ncbi:SigE family RNA polymerase sigma factor [Kutzneria buriramensis]|uniref:RNA polymerase sigma-70 factor (Sigma-E family) n=1 Tax=Kutzneria buriramensis TaxID=1045776 RepID=A0A3E0GTJ0_9PSEU|nr:SigE family RNA polymerase sigma factor [Kutzneria buriramensis]REH26171.1 RNA polymerase sigma-70 factor (sigma-E family) [Kutzneria buriramensis]
MTTETRTDEAYRDFVRSRAAPLHRTAYLLCGDWHLADDLVQEALAKAFRHWRKVRRADNPDAYVKRILVNEANRHWQRRAAPPTDIVAAEASAPDPATRLVERDELLHALLSLPVRQRATVVLRYLEGLSERETAAVLKCSEGTVKSQASRALAALRTVLNREELPL